MKKQFSTLFKSSIGLAFILFPFLVSANLRSSETIRGQKGLFRLLSADINETSAYHFRTSIEYSQQNDLLKDVDHSTVRTTKATIAFGYALLPEILLSLHSGYNISSREPDAAAGGAGSGTETYDLVKTGAAITGTYDVGRNFFKLEPYRFTTGASLWIDFSKVTRFFKSVNIVPTLIASMDYADHPVVPFRAHFNVGFRLANGARYFNDNSTVSDFERYSTDTINSFAITTGAGVEFPTYLVNPSLEVHMEKTADSSLSRTPKWLTVGLKGKPFPQKNVEIFGAVDVGLSSFRATSTPPVGVISKPDVGAVPLWNVVMGFALAQFGRKGGEIGVDQIEYNNVKTQLQENQRVVSRLQRDLEFNTVQGRVIDAVSKSPLEGVTLSFPDSSELKPVSTDADGKFVRYFKSLPGARLLFSKTGYESSSKFLSLKPGERVTVDIEMKKSTTELMADFVATITDVQGKGVGATVTLTNVSNGETMTSVADATGQVVLKVREGSYRLEIKSQGLKTVNETIDFARGKTVLRFYSMVP